MNLPIKKHYCIDPYLCYKEHDVAVQNVQDNIFLEAKKLLDMDKIFFIREKSSDAVYRIPDNSIDLLYIDGNHWYEFIKRDIELYYPKIKPGGVIGGHDFCATRGEDIGNAEVCRAVIDFVDKYGLQKFLDGRSTDWWIVRGKIK